MHENHFQEYQKKFLEFFWNLKNSIVEQCLLKVTYYLQKNIGISNEAES